MPTPHDALFKHVFSQPRHAVGELQHVLPRAAVDLIDWATLTLVPGSFVDDELRARHSDLLYSVRLAGREALIYVLLEHKSAADGLTAFQLLAYVVRVWQRCLRERSAARLPAVVAVVIHHSADGWQGPTDLQELLDLDPTTRAALGPFLPSLRFVLDDLSRVSEVELRVRTMSALAKLALFCLQRARHSGDLLAEFRRWAEAAREVLAAPDGAAALAVVLRYVMLVQELAPDDLRHFVRDEVGPRAEEVLMTTADQITREARELARREGRVEGRAAMLLHQLAVRFGPVPDLVAERVRRASSAELDRWGAAVLTAGDLAAVFDG